MYNFVELGTCQRRTPISVNRVLELLRQSGHTRQLKAVGSQRSHHRSVLRVPSETEVCLQKPGDVTGRQNQGYQRPAKQLGSMWECAKPTQS